MREKLEALIQCATLDIVDFDMHVRHEMNTVGRIAPFYVMSYLKSGEAVVRLREKSYVTKPGTIVILPPNEPHDHIKTSIEDAEFLWWHFNFKIADAIDVMQFLHLPVTFEMKNTILFESVFAQYVEANRRIESLPNIILKRAKGLEVLAYLLEAVIFNHYDYSQKDIPEVFVEILLDVVQNPSTPVSLDDLAVKYHMNPTYISNRFKGFFGISPIYLRREIVVNRAKEFLRTTEMNVSQIAYMLGFEDLPTFTRYFTEKQGMSPTKYKSLVTHTK